MKPKLRQSRILEVVAREGEATVEALAAEFDVSAETIRRDLAYLAMSGALQKVHGGARRLRLHAEGSFQQRMSEDAAAKQVIARKLATIVEPGDTLFMDTGTTTLFCAEALAEVERLTVITNSVRVAQALSRGAGQAQVFLLAATMGLTTRRHVGPWRSIRSTASRLIMRFLRWRHWTPWPGWPIPTSTRLRSRAG